MVIVAPAMSRQVKVSLWAVAMLLHHSILSHYGNLYKDHVFNTVLISTLVYPT
jgi:hypothetical protein